MSALPRACRRGQAGASSASLVRALSSHPRRRGAAVREVGEEVEGGGAVSSPSSSPLSSSTQPAVHPASSPMSIARTALLSVKPKLGSLALGAGGGLGGGMGGGGGAGGREVGGTSPREVVDESIVRLLSGRAGGALSPLPEVQLVESLTPDSPSHAPLRLNVRHLGEGEQQEQATTELSASLPTQSPSRAAQPRVLDSQRAELEWAADVDAASAQEVSQASSVVPADASAEAVLSTSLMEADLDYFALDREMVAVDALLASPTLSVSADWSTRARDALGCDDSEGEDDEEELGWDEEVGQVDVVELHARQSSAGGGKARREEEEEWEVCKVQEMAEDDYELV